MKKDTLKSIRLKRGLKQEDIAKQMGITKSAYGRWERSECYPRADKLILLSYILEVELTQLIDILINK